MSEPKFWTDLTEDEVFEEHAAGRDAVHEAREHFNKAPLLERLETAKIFTMDERRTVIDIITGKLKLPRHRPGRSQRDKVFDQTIIALNVRVCEIQALREGKSLGRKRAVTKIAEEMGIGAPTVDKAVSAHPELLHPSWPKPRIRK